MRLWTTVETVTSVTYGEESSIPSRARQDQPRRIPSEDEEHSGSSPLRGFHQTNLSRRLALRAISPKYRLSENSDTSPPIGRFAHHLPEKAHRQHLEPQAPESGID